MSQARAKTSPTVKSLNYLYKVCCCSSGSRSYSFSSIKVLSFVKNFSTLNSAATDESFDFRNPNGFLPTNGKSSSSYGKDWSFRESNSEFEENPNGVYRENSMGVQRNSSGVYGQSYDSASFRSEFQPNPDGNSGNYNKNCQKKIRQQSSNRLYEESRNVQSSYRMNCEVSGEVVRGGNGQYLEDNAISQETRGNYNMGNDGEFHQSSYNINSLGTRSFEQVAGEGSGRHFATYQQHTSRFDEKGVGVNGIYNGNASSGQHSSSDFCNDSSGASSSQHSSSDFCNDSSGMYNHIPNGSYSDMVNSQALSYSQPDENSVEAGEDRQLRGTIEELDSFCKERKLKDAVEVLSLLEQHQISVDIPRYLFLMRECGEAQALKEAKSLHEHLTRSVSHLDVRICNKILEMYSKCGSMEDAYMVFNKMAQRNLTSWDTMITWLAKNGHGEDAIDMFSEFKKVGLKPDNEMFLGVFTACSVLGDMKEGLLHFESMSKDYNIVPSMDHYLSVVEMLGSAGYLNEALEFIEKMPMEPGVEVWEIMMNQCRVHGDTELGDHCAELVELLDPSRLDEQSKAGLIPVKASDIAKEKEKKRLSSFNPLEVKTKVYEYRAGDTSHPDHEKLYALLRCLKQPMKEVGYVPETKFVLHDVDQESKEEALLSHSERLALSQALMTSAARAPIRIIKNLRVCGDCHNALKIISKLVGRLIVARDAKRFHHFENGVCSCGDYW